jgi:hypothetical protein
MRTRFLLSVSAFGVIGFLACTEGFFTGHKHKNVVNPEDHQLKLVWLSLDGLQPDLLEPWVAKIDRPHARGLHWLLKTARGNDRMKVINPTITAPSHISTITCAGPGVHGIFDNNTWTGQGMSSGFSMPYKTETWVKRLRAGGFRVASSLYPSIDGSTKDRSADIGLSYDSPGSSPQILTIAKGATASAFIPDRQNPDKKYPIEVSVSSAGLVSAKTPWGDLSQLTLARPADVNFDMVLAGESRKVAVSFMVLTVEPETTVVVSPIQVTPAMGQEFKAELDRENLVFSSLKDYRFQSNLKAYLAAMEHRRQRVVRANHLILKRTDVDAVFLYFEDLDTLLHAYIRDSSAQSEILEYLKAFDQELGDLLAAVPASADLVVLGDHGMSPISYVINARKILTEAVASAGTVMTGGGALYLYPPQGDLAQDPPAGLNLEMIAQTLRSIDFDLTGKRLFGKVIVRGTSEAVAEGFSGSRVPWISAFAQDGVAFKNSVEDRILLARAPWASIPEHLRAKYPDPMNNGQLMTPIPAGQHGHWNELPLMGTSLILEGPRVTGVNVDRSLELVPALADALGWPRPEACAKP